MVSQRSKSTMLAEFIADQKAVSPHLNVSLFTQCPINLSWSVSNTHYSPLGAKIVCRRMLRNPDSMAECTLGMQLVPYTKSQGVLPAALWGKTHFSEGGIEAWGLRNSPNNRATRWPIDGLQSPSPPTGHTRPCLQGALLSGPQPSCLFPRFWRLTNGGQPSGPHSKGVHL